MGIVKVVIPSLRWLMNKAVALLKGDVKAKTSTSRASKSIMNTSEDNDDYRLKVRQVSKSEEKQDAVIRRIDTSVDRLKETLLGDWNDDENNTAAEEEAKQRRHEHFEQHIKKMENDLAKKFAKIESLLRSQGYGH